MKPNRLFLVLGVSIILALIATASTAWAGISSTSETPLTATGQVYEMNVGTSGTLWLSDTGASEIWQLNSSTGQYTVYQGASNASDAKTDTAGDVWWSDYNNGRVGRITSGTANLTQWQLPGVTPPNSLGIAFDDGNDVWVGDESTGQLFHLDPSTNELCVYAHPGGSGSGFILWNAGTVWVSGNNSIVNLNPTSNSITAWQLATGHAPQRPVMDASGNLWFAEQNITLPAVPMHLTDRSARRSRTPNYVTTGMIAQLVPGSNQLTEYTLPVDTYPQSLYLGVDGIWYTAFHTVGILTSSTATGVVSTLAVTNTTVTPACSTITPTSSTLTTRTGTVAWTARSYTLVQNSNGWTVYQYPVGSKPWGIGGSSNAMWITDQGRQVLSRFTFSLIPTVPGNYIYLPFMNR